MKRIAITTDSVCDLPEEIIKEREIDLIYFNLELESGVFTDTIEITAENVIEYMSDGTHKATSVAPSASDYKKYFMNLLEEYDEIVHVCLSAKAGKSVKNASLARAQLGIDGQRIFVFDSMQISSGLGMIVLEATRLRDEGKSGKEIVEGLNYTNEAVYTSFITNNADYLYFNKRVSRFVMLVCKKFNIHPVLHMVDGELKLKQVLFGSYEKACKRYIKSILKSNNLVDEDLAFITYASVPLEYLEKIREYIATFVSFKQDYTRSASAAISANCGPDTFGVIFRVKLPKMYMPKE